MLYLFIIGEDSNVESMALRFEEGAPRFISLRKEWKKMVSMGGVIRGRCRSKAALTNPNRITCRPYQSPP